MSKTVLTILLGYGRQVIYYVKDESTKNGKYSKIYLHIEKF